MKYCLMFLICIAFFNLNAQQTGSIVGKLIDKELNDEPLAFANVLIKESTKGTTSGFDGLYELAELASNHYTIVYSYLGYKTVEVPNVEVVAGKVTTLNIPMSASQGVVLDEVVVTTALRKDSETALLLDQKKAIAIRESIGAQELAKMGVTDIATATTKISGVTSSEASGAIFVRGLGDRYLSTTLNGLPIPSDDVEKKNIDLSLFPTRVIQNVSISKTYSAKATADQSSGAINITSRALRGSSELSAGLSSGINSNVAKSGIWDDFKISPNQGDAVFGFYNTNVTTQEQITQQSWNTRKQENPIDYSFSLAAGKRIKEKLAIFFTGSHSRSYEYEQGLFRQYRSNFIDDTITDATTYGTNTVNTALLDLTYFANAQHKLKSVTFFINKLSESVFEGGRNGEATIFEETAPAEGLFQFIRDQNTKQTRLLVTQLLGTHQIGEKNKLEWAGGYNFLNADEPNRIRNEVNFDPNGILVQLGRNGGFQQRKSNQKIKDTEYNGVLMDVLSIIDKDEKLLKIEFGVSFRNKKRDFSSEFVGVEESATNAINPYSIDNLGSIFQQSNFDNGLLELNLLGSNANAERKDIYKGELDSKAAFVAFNAALKRWNFNAGLRYQKDEINVSYDIGNLFPRIGESTQDYDNVYPSLNIKYAINELHALRMAISRTLTLPEFKEVSPFEYVSPTGQVIRGNVDVKASKNINYDLKWEFFPSDSELVSVTAFYKDITDPINKVRDRGSAGVFSYFNSAKKAKVFGLEAEAKLNLIAPSVDNENEPKSGNELNLVLNATRMWHSQDLREIFNENGALLRTFRYKGITKTDLQGASDWIFNTSLNFNTVGDDSFATSLSANYASDKIFALGVPTDQSNRNIFYDDAIIEKGFLVLNGLISKEFGKHWKLSLIGKNLLNPQIKQTQKILRNVSELAANPAVKRNEVQETVRSYTTGITLSIGVNYNF
ncbi:MAG: TonB-dependent receptor [Flavobacteriaceae bacterium]|nr:MAG: TonB-dependent receptor [Flavobacteriaceae bacterium]